MARRTKDEAEKTRDAILDAAENVFHLRGVSRTSLEQIAAAAGVTRGAVYWHFKDKLALCDAMAQRVFLPHEDMLKKLAEKKTVTPLEDLRDSCLHSLSMIAHDKRRQKVVSILLSKCEYVDEMTSIMDRNNACKERMLMLSERLLTQAKALKMLSSFWTPRKAAVAIQAMMTGLIFGGLEGRRHFGMAHSGKQCLETFFLSLHAKNHKAGDGK